MPQILNQIADEILPVLFRRRRPLSTRQPIIGNDLPEQGGFGGNLLAPTQEPAGPKPAPPVIVPSNPAPTPQPTLAEQAIARATPAAPKPNVLAATPSTQTATQDPIVSQPGQVTDAQATRPARRVETDTRGRPTRNIALEGDEQTLDYANRVAGYEPQKGGGGWWPAIRTAIAGFAAGGPVGAATAFGVRKLREHFEPTLADEEWKREQLGQVAPAVQQIRAARKEQLGEASTMANIDLAKARTEALKNPRQNARIIERKDGVYMLNAKTNKFEKVAEIPPEAGTPGSTRYIPRADGVYGINAEHPEGFKVKGIPGNAGKDQEDVTFHNSQLQKAISAARAEQQKIDDGLKGIPRTIQSTDILGNPRTIANPDYTYNMTRRRQLDDKIRDWETKLKSTKGRGTADDSDPLGILNDEEP